MRNFLERQLQLQVDSYNLDPRKLEPEARAVWVAQMVNGCTHELHEALEHVGWRFWKPSDRHFDRDAMAEELVDALHFLLSLFVLTDWDADQIWAEYSRKAGVNADRQANGY